MDQFINKQQEEDGLAQSGPNQFWKLFFVCFFVFLIAISPQHEQHVAYMIRKNSADANYAV